MVVKGQLIVTTGSVVDPVLTQGNVLKGLTMDPQVRIRPEHRFETLQGGFVVLGLIIEHAYIEFMFGQVSVTDLHVFLGLLGIRAGGIGADQPFKGLKCLPGHGLISVDDLEPIKIAAPYLINHMGHGLILGMKVFEFLIGKNGFLILLAVVVGIPKLEFG
jgi:hypothetical protein